MLCWQAAEIRARSDDYCSREAEDDKHAFMELLGTTKHLTGPLQAITEVADKWELHDGVRVTWVDFDVVEAVTDGNKVAAADIARAFDRAKKTALHAHKRNVGPPSKSAWGENAAQEPPPKRARGETPGQEPVNSGVSVAQVRASPILVIASVLVLTKGDQGGDGVELEGGPGPAPRERPAADAVPSPRASGQAPVRMQPHTSVTT
jgi:hypothetical protein